MITHLNGILISKSPTEAVIECGGVGYSASISLNTSESLPEIGETITLQTMLIPREDSLQLYGFKDRAERDVFKLLITIPGIGGKTAISTLSSITPEMLRQYILTNNLHALQKLPGIGKKTAERIILELKDKLLKTDLTFEPSSSSRDIMLIVQEAVAAMETLGYSRLIAEKAIKSTVTGMSNEEITVDKLLRLALKAANK
jgi:Holliday junction DNA helicase RuvA